MAALRVAREHFVSVNALFTTCSWGAAHALPMRSKPEVRLTKDLDITLQRHMLLTGERNLTAQIAAELAQWHTPAGDAERTADVADEGVQLADHEMKLAIETTLKCQVQDVKHALHKIAVGTYGLCDACGEAIPWERLTARPQATLCLACKVKQERAGQSGAAHVQATA
jgi:DnaK suppressor protein